jgi:spermidine synthase
MDTAGRRWLDIPCPWSSGGVRLRALCRDGETVDDLRRALGNGDAGRPYILQDDETRELHFTRHAEQSAMSLAEPTELIAAYTRKMMAFLLFVPRPRRILMIGLGGGSLVKYCHRHLSSCQLTVVEENSDVIALRDEFCIPPDDERLTVIHEDGAVFMGRTTGQYDVILVDAYDRLGIAPSLDSAQFYADLGTRLSRHGSVVINLVGDAACLATHTGLALATLKAQLARVTMQDSDNTLLFALRQPALQSLPGNMESAALRLKLALKLDFPHYLRRIGEGARFRLPHAGLP